MLEEGATSRDVYLPGFDAVWTDPSSGLLHVGGDWIRDYPADLLTLPYFVREF